MCLTCSFLTDLQIYNQITHQYLQAHPAFESLQEKVGGFRCLLARVRVFRGSISRFGRQFKLNTEIIIN